MMSTSFRKIFIKWVIRELSIAARVGVCQVATVGGVGKEWRLKGRSR